MEAGAFPDGAAAVGASSSLFLLTYMNKCFHPLTHSGSFGFLLFLPQLVYFLACCFLMTTEFCAIH